MDERDIDGAGAAELGRHEALRDAMELWASSQDRAPISLAQTREHAPAWYTAATRHLCPR